MALSKLLYSIFVPNVTYACEVVNYYPKDNESLHVAVNDAIRLIFRYNRWESIKSLGSNLGYDMCNKVSILSLFEKELFYKLIDN